MECVEHLNHWLSSVVSCSDIMFPDLLSTEADAEAPPCPEEDPLILPPCPLRRARTRMLPLPCSTHVRGRPVGFRSIHRVLELQGIFKIIGTKAFSLQPKNQGSEPNDLPNVEVMDLQVGLESSRLGPGLRHWGWPLSLLAAVQEWRGKAQCCF